MTVLEPEAGIFYGVCWFVVIIRLISRRLHRGSWKRLQLDDYLILVAMVRTAQCTRSIERQLMHPVGYRHCPHCVYARGRQDQQQSHGTWRGCLTVQQS